jgi:hypothetical protein
MTSTFPPFTTMEQIESKENVEYVLQYLNAKNKTDTNAIHPGQMAELCSEAKNINNEELFWRSWAVLAQLLSNQPDTCPASSEEKTTIITEIAQLGGRTWGHEGIHTPRFH